MITIEYIQLSQSCRITTDTVDKNWNQIRFQYNQVSEQSEVFESCIELPWHTFISNLEILSLAINVYGVQLTFSSEAKALFDEGIKKKADIHNIDQLPQLSVEEIEETLASKGFLRRLTKEQLRNVSKLSRLNSGATFSVPGAGKTTEAIAFYILHKKDTQGLLVICPKSAFPAWEEQLSLCLGSNAPHIRRLTQGIEKIESDLDEYPNDVLLISYQQFIRTVSLIAKHLQRTHSYVFVDESHRIKGGDRTDTGKQIKRIAHLPVGKLIMSGTPMPNAVTDLLPQYSFLFPSDGEINENNIIEKIRKVYVRTTKNELLNPLDFPINTIRTEIPLNEPQKNLYDLIRSEELRQL